MPENVQRPLPQVTPWSRPFWDAAAERRLLLQKCQSCDTLIMYPKLACPNCLGTDLGWTEASGKGTVYTYTVQVAGAPSGFEDAVPYVVAVIQLQEGVQLMSNIVGDGATEVECGDQVEVDFETPTGAEVVLPVFRLTDPR